MDELLAAIEAHKAGIVNTRTVQQLAHDVLIRAANYVNVRSSAAMVVLLVLATDIQDEMNSDGTQQ